MSTLFVLTGTVTHIFFKDGDTFIGKVSLDFPVTDPDGSATSFAVVKGSLAGLDPSPGTWFISQGRWKEHPRFGNQIALYGSRPQLKTWEVRDILSALRAYGVGVGIADTLKGLPEAGDPATFRALLDDEGRLAAVLGDGAYAGYVRDTWARVASEFGASDLLVQLGLSAAQVRSLLSAYGAKVEETLRANPWAASTLPGFGWALCEALAKGFDVDASIRNPERIKAAVRWALREAATEGSLYLPMGSLIASVSKLDNFASAGVTDACEALAKAGEVVAEDDAVYLREFYDLEARSAVLLRERLKGAMVPEIVLQRMATNLRTGDDAEGATVPELAVKYLRERGESLGINLTANQQGAVLTSLLAPISIINGLPGTGKTTALRVLLRLLQDCGVAPLVVAPTGIAAKRAATVSGFPAFTIHKAFGAGGRGGESDGRKTTYAGLTGDRQAGFQDVDSSPWGFGPGNPHPSEVIVVDETSMVDQALLLRILEASRPDARLVFVGDAAQLPSVGPGNVLAEMARCRGVAVTALTEVFRQAEASPIVKAAHRIHRGQPPECAERGEFVMRPAGREEDACAFIVDLAQVLLERGMEFQVLSPKHKGVAGVTNLNIELRNRLNPASSDREEARFGGEVLREGDRVMVVKNDYPLGVWNGDVGKIAKIHRAASEVEVKIFGDPPTIFRIPYAKVSGLLRLAYATTVHKAQGSEFDVIVLPVLPSFGPQLQRNLYYTGVTRARKRCILVGSERALAEAVANASAAARYTRLAERVNDGND